ncbi:MAG: twin-arginine translocase subunit TatC [Bacteroidetes bacterium]|nr:twin-arginine translocase subunit TatC [Bacteroidota bacterium]
MEEEKQMSFLDHLEELRWRLVRCAIAIVILATVLWWNQSWIMDNLFLRMNSTDFWTFRKMCEWFGVCVDKIDIKMQSTEVSGQFSYALMMSVMGGIVLSFPFLFHQIWSFVKPGLKQNEKSAARGIIFYVSILFFLGIAFGYYIVAPLCIQFFGNFKISESIENIFTVNSYMSMVLSTVFYSGLLFLLPVVSYLLTKLGIINSEFLKKYRKHAIVGVLILAAVITPPDLISQVIVAIPITLLYEIGIFVAKRAEKKTSISE